MYISDFARSLGKLVVALPYTWCDVRRCWINLSLNCRSGIILFLSVLIMCRPLWEAIKASNLLEVLKKSWTIFKKYDCVGGLDSTADLCWFLGFQSAEINQHIDRQGAGLHHNGTMWHLVESTMLCALYRAAGNGKMTIYAYWAEEM